YLMIGIDHDVINESELVNINGYFRVVNAFEHFDDLFSQSVCIDFLFHNQFFAAKASAYILICLIIETNPLARVGERWSLSPISPIKSVSACRMASGVWFEKARISIAMMPLVMIASLSAVKTI